MTTNTPLAPFKAGIAALAGKPNVGKSTLLNALLAQKVAAVSPRPQTTRRRQLGILTTDEAQVIFQDTPGLHAARHKLGAYMNEEAEATLKDADVLLWVVDASQPPDEADELVAGILTALKAPPPTLLVLNKSDLPARGDLTPPENSAANAAAFLELLPAARPIAISAATGRGLDDLLAQIITILPPGEAFYSAEQVTDFYERDIAAELIREAALLHLREEIPHGIAVRIDEFKERSEEGAFIAATLFVERESHKGIVIGRGGEMMKRIGSTARVEIEEMSGRKVFLELRVKVNKNWRNNPSALQLLGYTVKK